MSVDPLLLIAVVPVVVPAIASVSTALIGAAERIVTTWIETRKARSLPAPTGRKKRRR